jgi:L-ascorbate metabolism protein UlaG (beta-lactamase superfamily)
LSSAQIQLSKVDSVDAQHTKIAIQPIWHGAVAFNWNDTSIYVDPHGGASLFESLKAPDIIIITDIHGDHFDLNTIDSLDTKATTFVVPNVVAKKLPLKYQENLVILKNGENFNLYGVDILAVPMYNFPEDDDAFHIKGRGNGYVLSMGATRIYLSGDTEDIPEMRNLENIDVAFLTINLPYTMTIEQAASATIDFRPKIVYPYHYRNKDKSYSDLRRFRQMVKKSNKDIIIRVRNFYPGE